MEGCGCVFGFLFGLAIAATIAVVIARDANRRGMMGPLWGLGVFLLLIVFLPLYLIVRKPLREEPTAAASPTPAVPPTTNTFCSTCGKPLQPGVKFCSGCGAQV